MSISCQELDIQSVMLDHNRQCHPVLLLHHGFNSPIHAMAPPLRRVARWNLAPRDLQTKTSRHDTEPCVSRLPGLHAYRHMYHGCKDKREWTIAISPVWLIPHTVRSMGSVTGISGRTFDWEFLDAPDTALPELTWTVQLDPTILPGLKRRQGSSENQRG
jgi:hypothetical protein